MTAAAAGETLGNRITLVSRIEAEGAEQSASRHTPFASYLRDAVHGRPPGLKHRSRRSALLLPAEDLKICRAQGTSGDIGEEDG